MSFLRRSWAEIDLTALENNFNLLRKQTKDSLLMAVVKANAYGHSTEIVVPFLDKMGVEWFAVSTIDEAVKLREIGIEKPILILDYTPIENAETLYKQNISQCVYSYEYAKALSDFAKLKNIEIKIHIKLDTGMSRIGFDCRDNELCGIEEAIKSAKLPNFLLEGIFTHYADSDRKPDLDDGFTDAQYDRFTKGVSEFKKSGLNPIYCHTCNSAATLYDNEKHLNICRPGIILYGLLASGYREKELGFKPVMTLKSVVFMVKTIKKGDCVGYGRTFKADKETKVATVAIGYGDGYPRIVSNKAYVIINGKKAKIIGRVCMDQMCVDVTGIDDVKIGDEVILFGNDLHITDLSETANTLNHEILCGITERVPRIALRTEE